MPAQSYRFVTGWLLGLGALFSLLAGWAPAADAQGAPGPRRVVSLSPNITESIFAIGAGDLLVGVSDFCNDPPAARTLRRCGGWANTNFEVLVDLRPDLILVLGQHRKVRRFGEERGFPVRGVSMDSVATISTGLLELGRLLGREEAATSLTARIKAELSELQRELTARSVDHRPTVFVSIGRRPGSLAGIHTSTGGSFLDEAITLAGGRNVFADVRTYYPQASKESIVQRRPEVILELGVEQGLTARQKRALIEDWSDLPSLPAVKSGRIYALEGNDLLIPGPRLPEIVRRFRAALTRQ